MTIIIDINNNNYMLFIIHMIHVFLINWAIKP